jgi:hypothetical protein
MFNLNLIEDIEGVVGKLNGIDFASVGGKLEELLAFADKLAKIAEVFGKFSGPYAPAIVGGATTYDALYQSIVADHKAAIASGVPTDVQGVQTVAKIAAAVATSGLIKNQGTAEEVQQIATTVGIIGLRG